MDSRLETARVSAAARRAREQAESLGRPVLAVVSLEIPAADPLGLFASWTGKPGGFWEQRSQGAAMAWSGSALSLSAQGPGRFSALKTGWDDARRDAFVEPKSSEVRAFCGAAFWADEPAAEEIWSQFPSTELTVPEVLATAAGPTCTLQLARMIDSAEAGRQWERDIAAMPLWPQTGTLEPEPRCEPAASLEIPPRAAWLETVGQAVEDIKAGRYQKVVLARRLDLELRRPVDPAAILNRLRARHPDATTFAIGRDGSCFLGATPERLLRVDGGTVEVPCIAGSAPRGAGVLEDRSRMEELLHDPKNRSEHELVVRSVEAALGPMCGDSVKTEGRPSVMTLPNIHHLRSLVRARANAGVGPLELLDALHPTAAVGGYPREEALPALRRLESIDRGWYAGPIGWLDTNGRAEFVVALRSALVSEARAHLFAGCGVIARSRPENEWDETVTKMQPMRSALLGE